jgi:xylulokinase
MAIVAIDLGTTNIKVAVYDSKLKLLAMDSENVKYLRDEDIVEFNAEQYFDTLISTVQRCCLSSSLGKPYNITQIVLTGQAESLVVIDKNGKPLRNGISWLDMRSWKECEELKNEFNKQTCYRITGQPAIIPTWPITKILWLRQHEPMIYSQVDKYLLLKDFIQFKLTGKIFGEYSIYNFSHYFDITKKKYWNDILSYCGVNEGQLPHLVEPCTNIGRLTKTVAEKLGCNPETTVNVGTLDHFSGMIGTGNIKEGIISESTGTVLSIATMVKSPVFYKKAVPCHYGPFKDTYVLLPVCESGGVSLEWFKDNFIADQSFREIDKTLQQKSIPNEIIFLPYITGVNAPDYNENASGVFYGIKIKHDKFDFALAVMEGISHILKENIDCIAKSGIHAKTIISTGGGARSGLWSQLKADITGYSVAIPENEESACLGAAMIGAVSEGIFKDYAEAVEKCVSIKKLYNPKDEQKFKKRHELFQMLYSQLSPVYQYNMENSKDCD